MIDIAHTSLLDLLPYNLTEDDNVRAAAIALDEQLHELTASLARLPVFSRMDDLTDEEADRMAWEFNLGFYDSTLPIEQKRELVKNAIKWHRKKGTPAAIEELIAALFGTGEVQEWWQYDGKPHHFRVVTSSERATNERAAEFIRAVNSVKRMTSVLEQVILSQTENLKVYHGSAVNVGEFITIGR